MKDRRWIQGIQSRAGVVVLVIAVACLFAAGYAWTVQGAGGRETAEQPVATGAPDASGMPEPTESAVPVQSPLPTVSAMPTQPPERYMLTSPKARFYKGGQTGIHYKKVKGKKVYHIRTYTTDSVSLSMSHPSRFRIYGGGSKKEVKKKYAAVSSKGVVKCKRRGKGEKVYTIVEATSKLTGEKSYIYIYFQEKLYCSNGKTISLYEKHVIKLGFNYGKKKLSFSASNKKVEVGGKGRVTGIKHGVAYVTVKVKDSINNQVRIRVVVKVEPWIVSDKNTCYDYQDMTKDLQKIHDKYPTKTSVSSLGTTADKRNIWCIRIGKAGAPRKLVIDAAIHAREWKNTQIIMRQTEEILRDYREHKKRFQKTCIYIIPMDNPDGVSISQYGFEAIRNKKLRKLCKKIGHAKIWKANARGVDLNDNFPVGTRKKWMKKKPDYMAYPGKKASSERETKALIRFIQEIKPKAVLNLHSTGSIIYWDFDVDETMHDKLYEFASKVSSFNEYRMMPSGGGTEPAGGFADWLNYKEEIVSITIETGTVACPLPHSQYKSVYKKNNKMFRWYMTEY